MKAREDRCLECAPLALSWLIFAAIWFPLASANGQTYSVEQAARREKSFFTLRSPSVPSMS